MAECPRCSQPIQQGATFCSCGWRERVRREKQEEPRQTFPCAHETCGLPAVCRVKTSTGWADLCKPHYVRFFDNQARARCEEKGLLKRPEETADEYHKRMMAYMRSSMKPKTFDDARPMSEEDRVKELV